MSVRETVKPRRKVMRNDLSTSIFHGYTRRLQWKSDRTSNAQRLVIHMASEWERGLAEGGVINVVLQCPAGMMG